MGKFKPPMVVYRGEKPRPNSWVRYLIRRIFEENKNNLVAMIGQTGSGKTYSAISICEMISRRTKIPFSEDNIVFSLKELMTLINSKKLKKGSLIIFDEPQVSISNREWQSEANRIFNYLLSTFRHRNFTLFFCTPYDDLLDKAARKLFHFKFETVKINTKDNTCALRPVELHYDSNKGDFLQGFLKVCYKPENKSRYKTFKLREWKVTKPDADLLKKYEDKKLQFTSGLNKEIEQRLDAYQQKKNKKLGIKSQDTLLIKRNVELTPREREVKKLKPAVESRSMTWTAAAELLGISRPTLKVHFANIDRKEANIQQIP